jgi:tetratricopeptide (TPR) repeat protein
MQKVLVTDEFRMFPAYTSMPAEELPMFAENRVHQRSSGNPYPCRIVARVDRQHREERLFRVITLENEYLRLELMPELGGRIYAALDKRTGYDFFYRQHVVKPALIGMLGNWISGGVEFNWPCHHRPSTYMPVDVSIEEETNGTVIVWMSENEPLNRMKGMVGVSLAPGEARFDTRIKLYNGTPERHSFLWWENAAVPVNQQYRLVFPPDVHYVQFHYRKNVTTYPVASGVYNGIRFGDGADISYHKNTKQPTSYFCAPSKYDFFGGYDEGKRCGVIHVANRHVSVGKKMFTWAYHQLSQSWKRALTDADGEYAELMASSYSLNQPDFAWLMPYESKEFSQLWYPIGDVGVPLCACAEASFSVDDGKLKVQCTVPMLNARLTVNGIDYTLQANPEQLFTLSLAEELQNFCLADETGRILLSYEKPEKAVFWEMPSTLPDNPTLDQLKSAQDLYLMGTHVVQYRDPAIRAAAYWREALYREPDHLPSLIALSSDELGHFRPEQAWKLAQHAWHIATARNFHMESGELDYLRGRILEVMQRSEEALDAYLHAAWSQDACSRAMTRAAMIELRLSRWHDALHHAEEALIQHAHNETAMLVRIVALRRLGSNRAETALVEAEAFDSLNVTLRALKYGATKELYSTLQSDACQSALDIAQDLTELGETTLAAQILSGLPNPCAMTAYVYGFLTGDCKAMAQASQLDVGAAYPLRWLEYQALTLAIMENPHDATALNLLGCLIYNAEDFERAAELWEQAIKASPTNYMAYRNLAVAYYSHLECPNKALSMLDKALALHPGDGQLVWEKAYLMTRLRCSPMDTVDFIASSGVIREDVILERCRALNIAGQYERVIALMESEQFIPCEGGEHAVAEQYMFAHHALGRKAVHSGDLSTALEHFRAAQQLPDNLGAGLWNEVILVPHQYYEAICRQRLGDGNGANKMFAHILQLKNDYFSNMYLPELPCWQAMVLMRMGNESKARELLAEHVQSNEQAATARDAGYYKTTPFFISYMEKAEKLRRAGYNWQMAMSCWASGDIDRAATFAEKSLKDEPANLYATIIANGL